MERMKFSLDTLALNFFKIPDKGDLIESLKKEFKVRSKDKLYSAKGLPHHPLFKEYVLNDLALTYKLHHFLKKNGIMAYENSDSPKFASSNEKLGLKALT
jgi:hypothetical protein